MDAGIQTGLYKSSECLSCRAAPPAPFLPLDLNSAEGSVRLGCRSTLCACRQDTHVTCPRYMEGAELLGTCVGRARNRRPAPPSTAAFPPGLLTIDGPSHYKAPRVLSLNLYDMRSSRHCSWSTLQAGLRNDTLLSASMNSAARPDSADASKEQGHLCVAAHATWVWALPLN